MPMPISTGKADMDTMVNGMCKNPIAPKVHIMPRKTTGMGSSDHFTWLKEISRATIMSRPARARMGPLLLAISSVIDCMSAGLPVTVTTTSGGKSAIFTWPDVSV